MVFGYVWKVKVIFCKIFVTKDLEIYIRIVFNDTWQGVNGENSHPVKIFVPQQPTINRNLHNISARIRNRIKYFFFFCSRFANDTCPAFQKGI